MSSTVTIPLSHYETLKAYEQENIKLRNKILELHLKNSELKLPINHIVLKIEHPFSFLGNTKVYTNEKAIKEMVLLFNKQADLYKKALTKIEELEQKLTKKKWFSFKK